MNKESLSIIFRRFTSRILESGLLLLAVALGVGTAAAGLTLWLNTQTLGEKLLASPTYREILVTTQSSASDMTQAAMKKPTAERTVLTSADLKASASMDLVKSAYIANESELRFINQAFVDRMTQMQKTGDFPGAPPGVNVQAQGEGSQTGSVTGDTQSTRSEAAADTAVNTTADSTSTQATQAGMVQPASAPTSASTPATSQSSRDRNQDMLRNLDLQTLSQDKSLILVQTERLKGLEVTSGYFDAWGIEPEHGSLFTDSDATSSGQSNVVLGSNFARSIMQDSGISDGNQLVGKKILTFGDYRTIVGIAKATGRSGLDDSYWEPYRAVTASENGPPRRGAFNTALRFSVSKPEDLGTVATWLDEWFTKQWGEGRVVVTNPRTEAQNIIARNQGISLLILFLALSGLFIASVNVSNILVSRGLRMRKNTGILMSLGASRSAILRLFGAEAVLVAGGGSLLGLGLAIPLAASMQQALELADGNLLLALPGALMASLLVLAFTLIPAWQNSRVQPADAMRTS